jgi:hypothetical protein
MPKLTADAHLLEAALIGYQAQVDRITAAIREIEKRLGTTRGRTGTNPPAPSVDSPRLKRKITAKGRAAIRAAVKRRWAAFRAAQKTGKPKSTGKSAAKPAPKRKLSPAARAKVVANLRKARAAKAAKKTAGEGVPF